MRNFYILKGGQPCRETKNVYPQIIRPIASKGSEIYNKITNLRNKSNPDAKGLVIELELDSRTNATDFVSQSWIGGIGLLVSKTAFEFISQFSLQPELEIYKVLLHHKDKLLDYIWINPTFNYDYDIDFKRTEFFLFDFLDDIKIPIIISDETDLVSKRLQYNPSHNIIVNELYLANHRVLKLDLFLMSIGSTNIRISEKFYSELKKTDLTAFEVKKGLPFIEKI